jgi:hypothetical protein
VFLQMPNTLKLVANIESQQPKDSNILKKSNNMISNNQTDWSNMLQRKHKGI